MRSRPAGRLSLAQRAALGRRHENNPKPRQGRLHPNTNRGSYSTPDLRSSVMNSCSKLHLAMVLCLGRDVIHHNLPLRLAHAERTVPFLPCESVTMLAHLARTMRLQFPHGRCQWQNGTVSNK